MLMFHEWLKPRVGVAIVVCIYASFLYEVFGKV